MQEHKPSVVPRDGCKVRLVEGAANNLPDSAAHATASEILQLAKAATEDDLTIVLVSGGGSALLPMPAEGITLVSRFNWHCGVRPSVRVTARATYIRTVTFALFGELTLTLTVRLTLALTLAHSDAHVCVAPRLKRRKPPKCWRSAAPPSIS